MDVPVDANGNWAFPAPESNGPLRFTAETVNGFSSSGGVSLVVEVSDLAAPVIISPAEGAALNTVTRLDGTGTPGLTVKLTGDISGTAVVADDGQWTIPIDGAEPGRFTIRAVQTSPGKADSPSVTRNFSIDVPVVAPVAPAEPVAPAVPAAPANPAATGITVLPAGASQQPVLPAASAQLPDTGAGPVLPTAGLAGGAILLGGVLLAATRRRAVS